MNIYINTFLVVEVETMESGFLYISTRRTKMLVGYLIRVVAPLFVIWIYDHRLNLVKCPICVIGSK